MKSKILALVGALIILTGSAFAAPQFDPNTVYAGKAGQATKESVQQAEPGEKGSITVLRLNSYAHLGEFNIPEGTPKASVERFNNKVYVQTSAWLDCGSAVTLMAEKVFAVTSTTACAFKNVILFFIEKSDITPLLGRFMNRKTVTYIKYCLLTFWLFDVAR